MLILEGSEETMENVLDPGSGLLRVEVAHDGGAAVRLRLIGELDLLGASVCERALRAFGSRAPVRLELDVGQLSFLDAAGLRCLLAAERACGGPGSVELLDPPSIVRRVLHLAGLQHLLRPDRP